VSLRKFELKALRQILHTHFFTRNFDYTIDSRVHVYLDRR
jgi:hypothetical protein